MSVEKQDFDGRLASVETSISNLEDGFKKLSNAMDRLAGELRNSQKPNYGIWISLLSFVATIFVGFWVVLELKVQNEVLPTRMSLIEVETQFNAEAQIRNVQWSEQQLINAEIWNATALGKLTPYPEAAPYYQPNISKEAR